MGILPFHISSIIFVGWWSRSVTSHLLQCLRPLAHALFQFRYPLLSATGTDKHEIARARKSATLTCHIALTTLLKDIGHMFSAYIIVAYSEPGPQTAFPAVIQGYTCREAIIVLVGWCDLFR